MTDLSNLVKPLVWEHHPMGYIAAPPTGRPYIIDIRAKGRVFFIKGMEPPPKVDTLEAAKSAAQADYTARILAALDPDAVAAMLAEAEERGRQMERDNPAVDVPDGLIDALLSGRQADMDGIMVVMSREACERAADILAAISARNTSEGD